MKDKGKFIYLSWIKVSSAGSLILHNENFGVLISRQFPGQELRHLSANFTWPNMIYETGIYLSGGAGKTDYKILVKAK